MTFSAAAMFLLAQAANPAPAAQAARPQAPTKATFEAQARDHFQRVDANKDGKVDKAEAEKAHAAGVATRQAQRRQQIAAAFTRLDTNKDGNISRAEFEASQLPKPTPERWFGANDIDRNGTVVLNEAVARAQRNFEALDTNKNGSISADEIRASRSRRNASN